jgi:hypothetical protein
MVIVIRVVVSFIIDSVLRLIFLMVAERPASPPTFVVEQTVRPAAHINAPIGSD